MTLWSKIHDNQTTVVTHVRLSVCLFSARYLENATATITKLDTEVFHHESCKPVYFGVKRSKVSRETKPVLAWVFVLLWVTASSCCCSRMCHARDTSSAIERQLRQQSEDGECSVCYKWTELHDLGHDLDDDRPHFFWGRMLSDLELLLWLRLADA